MNTEALVIGGGLAGSAVAITLARAGRQVILVEREAVPHHKVCGEFLSHEALGYLRTLGIDPAVLGAVPIHSVRLTRAGKTVQAPLPFAAMSLTRRCLDEQLLHCAAAAGVTLLRGSRVDALASDGDRWSALPSHHEPISAASVFLATGKHDMRGHPRPAGAQRGMVAFKMYWRLDPAQTAALAGHVELISYRGGYAGLQPVEDGTANLCCLVQAAELQRLGSRWEGLLASLCGQSHHLRMRLRDAEPLLPRPLAIASIPYGFLRENAEGLWHLGDQAAVIPSFTGDGMSIALHTAIIAAEMYRNGSTAAEFQQHAAAQLRRQVRFATTLSQLLVRFPKAAIQATGFWPHALPLIASRTRIASTRLAV